MKWMAEYFLAAWALQEACTSADTFCLLPAASADIAKDATSAVASVAISSLFMFISLLCLQSRETLITRLGSEYFPVSLFRNNWTRHAQQTSAITRFGGLSCRFLYSFDGL